eukprot:jgi/Chlat1/9044/Chrsp94S08309
MGPSQTIDGMQHVVTGEDMKERKRLRALRLAQNLDEKQEPAAKRHRKPSVRLAELDGQSTPTAGDKPASDKPVWDEPTTKTSSVKKTARAKKLEAKLETNGEEDGKVVVSRSHKKLASGSEAPNGDLSKHIDDDELPAADTLREICASDAKAEEQNNNSNSNNNKNNNDSNIASTQRAAEQPEAKDNSVADEGKREGGDNAGGKADEGLKAGEESILTSSGTMATNVTKGFPLFGLIGPGRNAGGDQPSRPAGESSKQPADGAVHDAHPTGPTEKTIKITDLLHELMNRRPNQPASTADKPQAETLTAAAAWPAQHAGKDVPPSGSKAAEVASEPSGTITRTPSGDLATPVESQPGPVTAPTSVLPGLQEAPVTLMPIAIKPWLEELGLAKYYTLFELHEVDTSVLPVLTLEDLREMGVTAVGPRRKLHTAISQLPRLPMQKSS